MYLHSYLSRHFSALHHLLPCRSAVDSISLFQLRVLCAFLLFSPWAIKLPTNIVFRARTGDGLCCDSKERFDFSGAKYSLPVCFTRVHNRPKLRANVGILLKLGHRNQWRFCGKLSIIHIYFNAGSVEKHF